MERAVNPQTGEVLFLVGNQWVPPAQTAKNDKGDTAYLINNRWEIVPGSQAAPAGLASLAKPEPILSPEEQVMGAVGAAPQEAIPRLPGGQAEMRPYEPSLTDQLMELLPGNKYKAANEYAARQIAKERGVPVGEIYKDIGGARPMFNPEGRAPIRAGVEAAKITAQELPKVPEATLSTFLKAYRAGDIEAPADAGMVDKAIAAMKPTDAKGKPDPNYESFLGLGESLGFSVATMVASLTAAAAGEVVAGPVGGVSAGMAASGAMAYRASKDDFLSRVRDKLNGESQKLYGTNISPEDWNKAKKEYNQAAVEYGAWEAIPEAVSNAVFIKAFAAPARAGRGADKIGSFLEKVGSQGVEQATETMTALGQNAAEMKAGLSDEELTIADAFRQQFIQTLLIGGTMAGGMKGKQAADKFYREVVEPRVRPGSALAKAIQADVDAVAFNPESTRRAAVEALNPNRAQEQVVAEPGIASLVHKQQIAMPPPPEEPEEEILSTPPSKSQDMDAMLREVLGEPAPTIPAGIVKEKALTQEEIDKQEKEAKFLAEMQDLQDDVSDRDDKYIETPAAKVKPAETVFTAPAGFAYSVTQSPAYGGADPLSAEDAEFELDTLLENAKRGRLTPQRFAESEIGRRLDTVQVMAINDGIRNNPIATIEALIQKVAPEAEVKAAPAKEVKPQTKDVTLYHGTNTEYDEIDPSKSGGMAFFGEDESVGARYAQNGGGGRARLDDSQKYIVNSNGVVYELEGDSWKAVGIAPEEGLINQATIQPLNKAYPSLSGKEAEKMTNPDSGSAGVVPKSSRIIKKDFSGLNLLDISTPEGRDVIAGLKPKTQTGVALVEAAQFDARDKRDRNSTTQLNSNFWGITKYAAAKGQQLRADIVDPLKAMGYDGIQFQDDQHKSVGLFDTGLKKEKQQKKKIQSTTAVETREEYPALSKTEVEELGLAPKPKVQKPAEPKIDYLNHPDNVGSDASSKREFDNKGKLQVAPQNIADGGTPFKSRAAADVARKNYPDMRVLPTADKKGFILAPKTPKQIEADKAKAKRLGLPMTTTKGTPMAAHQFITSEGGITKDAMKDLGMDENVRSGNRSLFTDTGMSVEQAYMKLQEAGYLEEGATQNDARNLITESVKKPKYRQQDTEEMAKRAEQADYEDYLKAEEEASLYSPVDEEMGYEMGDFEGTGYEGASPEVQAEVRALLAQADALGINTESIREEIFYETENQSIQAYYKAFKSALEDAITTSRQDRIEDTGQPGGAGDEFKLTSATPDEIRTKLYETESRAKEEERAKKAAEDKARADEQAAEFTLTGSDRAADVAAARGQRDIFAEAPAEETPKPQTEQERTVSIPKKEFREDKETRGKSDHPALKMVFKGETPKSLIAKYGEKNVRFLGRLFDIDVKDKFNVAKKLIAIDSGLSLVRGKDKAYFDKMNKAQLGEFLAAVGQSAYGQKYQLVERLLKHEGNVMGKFNDNLQDLKHKAAVLNEARAGKPISEEVLKDYPDVAAFTLPRDSEGYKAAIRTLAVRALPTLGMDTPATIASYREDAKTTKDPLEKNVANDIADYMESYYKSQQEKSNQTMAKLGTGTGPTMGEMIAENKRVKAELAALEKGEAAPIDNKKEIADLRKEQKALMMQIVKAGMEETPVQEARMAEIEKRIAELEGKPAKPEVKKPTLEEIRDQITDLEEQYDNEEDKDKLKSIASKIYKLQGQLQTAEGAAEKLNKLNDPAEFEKALEGFEDAYGDPKQARRELKYYKTAVDGLIKKGGSIYRVLFVESENDIDENNLGTYWTVHSSNIDKYVDNLADNADEGTQPYVIQAKVPPNSVSNQGVDIRGNPDEEEVNIVANKDDITYTVHEYSNKQVGPAIRELGKEEPAAPTEAETEAAEEAAEEAIRNKAEAEIDEGPIGRAIAKIENGDIETKGQIRTFIAKLERDGTLDDV